jgi:hypothetical protein
MPGMGLRRELHGLLRRRGRRQHHSQQRPPLPQRRPQKCLMAKDGKKKKVHPRATPKYTTSSDEGSSSDNEDDLLALFVNLNMEQKKKLNELIATNNEKDDLLESQEDFLVKENKKFVKLKNAYALEVEKNKNLSKELSTCHDSISCLRIENDNLVSKIEELNVCKTIYIYY